MQQLSVEIRSEAVRHRPLFMRRGIGCDGLRNLPSASIENRREAPKVELRISLKNMEVRTCKRQLFLLSFYDTVVG